MSINDRARKIEELYQELELKILKDIAKVLKKGTVIDKEYNIINWKAEKLKLFREVTERQKKIIAEYSGKTIEEVDKFVKEVGKQQVENTEKQLEPFIQLSVIDYLDPNNFISDTLDTLSVMNANKFNLINSRVLYYAGETYTDIVTKASVEAMSGNITVHQAMVNAVREAVRKGIPALKTVDGRSLSLEGHIPTVIRATQKSVIVYTEEEMYNKYGIDLVEISSHLGSRPSHAPFQGKIYSRSGTSDKYPALEVTGYGKIDGLITGINCRHQMYPYIEGVSVKRYEPYDKKENERVYKEQQQQRSLERAIRKAKKEKEVLQEIGADIKDIQKANDLIRKRQKTMREFIKRTGRTRNRERERVVRWIC